MTRLFPTLRCATLLTLTICPAFVGAQEVNGENLDEPGLRDAIRTRYVNSPNLPDGITFVSTLRLTNGLNSDHPDGAEAMVIQNMGIDAERAKKLISQMNEALKKYESDFYDHSREIACENGTPKAAGDQVFEQLDAFDDEEAALSEQYYTSFLATLDEDTAARFQQWLDYQKLSIEHVTFDHKEMASHMGVRNVDSEIATLCAQLEV